MKFYQDKKKVEYTVGLFTIIALLILFFGYGWLSEYYESRKYTEVRVSFTNAANIEEGSPVTILGVKKGRVSEIIVQEQKVLLTLQVKLDFPLRDNTEFRIMESNLMGDVQIEITPGNGDNLLELEAYQPGGRSYNLSNLITEFSRLLDDFNLTLKQIGTEDGITARIGRIVENTDQMISKLNNSMDDNLEDLDLLLDNTALLTGKLNALIDENYQGISGTVQAAGQAMSRMDSTMIRIEQVSADLNLITGKILEGDNTVNSLISEEELYDNLVSVTMRLDSLLIDVKENPKKYFKIGIF